MTIKLEELKNGKQELEITLVIRILDSYHSLTYYSSGIINSSKELLFMVMESHVRIVNEYRLHATTWNRLQQASLCLSLSSVLSVCGV